MGLSCANINLLLWTRCKANYEHRISIASMEKMAIAREMKEVTRKFNAERSIKSMGYYDENGQFNKLKYSFLMGNCNYLGLTNGSVPFKDNYNMVLCDYKGNVVMSDEYARHLRSVLGPSCIDALGNGSTFDQDKIPAIIASITGYSEDEIVNGIKSWEVNSHSQTTSNQTSTGSGTVDITDYVNAELMQYIDIYYPIFQAASANGWTTRYNNEMAVNPDAISDYLINGNFQVFEVNDYGQYEPGIDVNYFVTCGCLESKTDSDRYKDIEAKYEMKKEAVQMKEEEKDMEIQELSVQLEAAKTMLEQLKKQIDDNIKVFSWGNQ